MAFDGGDTWFLLANHISQGQTVNAAKEAFLKAKAVGKTDPTVVFTDGLQSYGPATQGVFSNSIHISNVGMQGRLNNNRMERPWNLQRAKQGYASTQEN